MSYLVGYTPDRSGNDALALGRMLALRAKVELVVCLVLPETWGHPSPANVEAEYKLFLDQHAAKSLDRARKALGDGVKARFLSTAANGAVAGLARVAEEVSAEMTILGSTRDGPALRCSFGSVASGLIGATNRLLALTPRGFKRDPERRLERVSCAYIEDGQGGQALGGRALTAAAEIARRNKVPLRLVTFVVRDRQMYPSGVGYDAENIVANSWREQAAAAQLAAIAGLPRGIAATATGAIGDGPDWRHAIASIDWRDGELLVAGAHSAGLWSGLIFGSAFTRLLRHVTVPIVAVP